MAALMQGVAPFLLVIVLDYTLRKAITGPEQDLGFTLTPRRSIRHPAVVLTDLDYVDQGSPTFFGPRTGSCLTIFSRTGTLEL